MRIEYEKQSLEIKDLLKNPFDMFKKWWQELIDSQDPMRDAVFLASALQDQPDARIVLLKSFDDKSFTFFTNYQSAKALELLANPKACMVFYWPTLERQVRLRGIAEKTNREISEDYFKTRAKGSQMSAWASPQSQIIKDRIVLEDKVLELEKKFAQSEIPCPPHWGGFSLKPSYFEYWQGRKDRLHDRFIYELNDHDWSIKRLAP